MWGRTVESMSLMVSCLNCTHSNDSMRRKHVLTTISVSECGAMKNDTSKDSVYYFTVSSTTKDFCFRYVASFPAPTSPYRPAACARTTPQPRQRHTASCTRSALCSSLSPSLECLGTTRPSYTLISSPPLTAMTSGLLSPLMYSPTTPSPLTTALS